MVFMKRSQFIGAKDQRLYIFLQETTSNLHVLEILQKIIFLNPTALNQVPHKLTTTKNLVIIDRQLPQKGCDSPEIHCETSNSKSSNCRDIQSCHNYIAVNNNRRLSLKTSNFEVFDQNIGFHRFITWETLSNHKTFKLSCFSTFTAGLTIKFVMISVKFNS